jgi:hypothetical protein
MADRILACRAVIVLGSISRKPEVTGLQLSFPKLFGP